jgi:Type IV pili methyl-accepting chemotaxis transducer N-term
MTRSMLARLGAASLQATWFATAVVSTLSTAAIAEQSASTGANLTLAQFVDERGGSKRIDYTAKLRMLSQRIPADACVYAAGGEKETAAADLKGAAEEFSRILKALEVGDDGLGIIGPEDNARILAGLKKLSEEWTLMETAVNDLLAGGDAAAALATLYEHNGVILGIVQKLVPEVSGVYALPNAMPQASAFALDLAGRQRMLSQRILMEACKIATGAGTAEDVTALQTGISNFDATLNGLIDGMPEAGLMAAPTPEIKSALVALRDYWQPIKPVLDGLIGGGTLDSAGLGELLVEMDKILADMDAIVRLYTEAAGHQTH